MRPGRFGWKIRTTTKLNINININMQNVTPSHNMTSPRSSQIYRAQLMPVDAVTNGDAAGRVDMMMRNEARDQVRKQSCVVVWVVWVVCI
jgi:hypothetical protein